MFYYYCMLVESFHPIQKLTSYIDTNYINVYSIDDILNVTQQVIILIRRRSHINVSMVFKIANTLLYTIIEITSKYFYKTYFSALLRPCLYHGLNTYTYILNSR